MLKAHVSCGKCGCKMYDMKVLKPVRDIIRSYNNKCPSCGQSLSADFAIEVDVH